MKQLYGYNTINDEDILIPENEFLIDGYDIAERLLEGLLFKVTAKDGKVDKVELYQKQDEGYFEQFNKKMFLNAAAELAQYIIDGNDVATLSKEIQKKYNVHEDGGFK